MLGVSNMMTIKILRVVSVWMQCNHIKIQFINRLLKTLNGNNSTLLSTIIKALISVVIYSLISLAVITLLYHTLLHDNIILYEPIALCSVRDLQDILLEVLWEQVKSNGTA